VPQIYDLCTEDAVKEAIRLPGSNSELESLIPDYISSASYAILNLCNREFICQDTSGDNDTGNLTRRFKVEGYRVDFSPYDLQYSTKVLLHPEQPDATVELTNAINNASTTMSYILKPVSPARGVYQSLQFSGFLVIVSQTLMQYGYALVDVTGKWGFPTIPPDISRAAVLTVASWLTRTSQGGSTTYGIPAGSAQGAAVFRNDWHIPWAAKKLIEQYTRGSDRWSFY